MINTQKIHAMIETEDALETYILEENWEAAQEYQDLRDWLIYEAPHTHVNGET